MKKTKNKTVKKTETDQSEVSVKSVGSNDENSEESTKTSNHLEEIAQLKKNIEDLKLDVSREREKPLRLQAEFENFRKRTANEFSQIIKSAGERLIKQLLPVIDDFERLFNRDNEKADRAALLKGIELIHQKLQSILSAEGLTPINALGEPFDSEFHEALSQIEDFERPNGTVINEIEKGYRLGEKIIRFSKVIVSKLPEETEEKIEKSDE